MQPPPGGQPIGADITLITYGNPRVSPASRAGLASSASTPDDLDQGAFAGEVAGEHTEATVTGVKSISDVGGRSPMSTTAGAASEAAQSDRAGASRRNGTFYRGDPGMWSWVLHRITGVLTFFFLFVHVLDTALVRVSPNAYDEVIETYKNADRQPDRGRPGRRRAVPRAQRPAGHAGRLLGQGPALPEADALEPDRALGAGDGPRHLLHAGAHRRARCSEAVTDEPQRSHSKSRAPRGARPPGAATSSCTAGCSCASPASR